MVPALVESLATKKIQENVPTEKESEPYQVCYHALADKALVARGNELKLVSREVGGRKGFFEDAAASHFGNRISSPEDEVRLFITPSEIRRLLLTLDWSRVPNRFPTQRLLQTLEASFDGISVRAAFDDALLGVAGLLQVAAEQAERLHEIAEAREADEVAQKDAAFPDVSSHTSNIIDTEALLATLTSLGDQLHQIAAHSEGLDFATKQAILGQADLARVHTALGRLGSFLSLPTDK